LRLLRIPGAIIELDRQSAKQSELKHQKAERSLRGKQIIPGLPEFILVGSGGLSRERERERKQDPAKPFGRDGSSRRRLQQRASYEIYKQNRVPWRSSNNPRRSTDACRQVRDARSFHSASRQGTHRSHHRLKKALFRVPHVYLAREGTSTRVHLRVSRGDCLASFEIARISRRNYVGRHEKRVGSLLIRRLLLDEAR